MEAVEVTYYTNKAPLTAADVKKKYTFHVLCAYKNVYVQHQRNISKLHIIGDAHLQNARVGIKRNKCC